MPKLNKVSISNGLFIDGTRVDGLTDINIESSVDNVSAITMKFYGIIDGLDNIQETYQFKEPEKNIQTK
ncbi:hypothetical protein [Enterococcus durans]|uniref:hypothetical protein n=1 Tax=Enterococcus durans TaxID=53345 RepID=UPI001E52DA74|nr:hypothetical protein [Enterococcus durans]MDB1685560.1 hypothetical protein [Enterococcus durans]